MGDIYYSKGSLNAALIAALAAATAVDLLLTSAYQRGYFITRPPGHHSKCAQSAGFCIFNNIALAARQATEQGQRVCIFDWDVHHGDGTQRFFYSDPDVLFVSLHRCDELSFYPWNEDMKAHFIGDGAGRYRNVNVAW